MSAHLTGMARLLSLAAIAPEYVRIRREQPLLPAMLVYQFVMDNPDGLTLEQYTCWHQWPDDEGHNRMLCRKCGLDGDG